MSWAQDYLVKRAVRLGVRLRRGGLSASAVKRLREAGMLRSPERMASGLGVGNKALMERYGIKMLGPKAFNALAGEKVIGKARRGFRAPTRSVYRPVPPSHDALLTELERTVPQLQSMPFTRVRRLAKITAARMAKARSAIGQSPIERDIHDIGGLSELRRMLKGLGSAERKTLRQLFQRHEIDEIRAMAKQHRQGSFLLGPMWGHGEKVLKRERELRRGLSSGVKKFVERLRALEGL